jgi:hypothetical protein
MKILINFSDEKFRKSQIYNSLSAIKFGNFDKVIEYSPKDIDLNFKNKYSKIFSNKRGFGLWLWKPYFILKTLKELNDGDYLFYCDSGAYFLNDIDYLIRLSIDNNQSIIGFDLPLIERQFTKRLVFSSMSYYDYSSNQILATYILFKKDINSLNFVNEWLNLCTDENLLDPVSTNEQSIINEYDDFVSHREDQSLFSILYKKNELISFRDPSQYGDRPFEYRWVPKLKPKYKEWVYQPIFHHNSNYPRIINLTRGVNINNFKIKEKIKSFLNKLNVYNENMFKYIHK